MSRGATPTVGSGREWGPRPLSSLHCPLVSRGCHPPFSEVSQLPLPSSTVLGVGGSHICSFLFSLVMEAARPPLPHLCSTPSLHHLVQPQWAHSGWNAASATIAFQAAECGPQPDTSTPCSISWGTAQCLWLCLCPSPLCPHPASPAHSNMPSFGYLSVGISQMSQQGILC